MFVANIHQLHLMPETVLGVLIIGKDEIQDSNGIDTFKFKIPDSFLTLILYRKR